MDMKISAGPSTPVDLSPRFTMLKVTEIFHSIQGETSHSGLRYAFVRLTGCDLRCTYCDSAYAFNGGKRMSFEDILAAIDPYAVRDVLLTGGEPLLQRNTPELARLLSNRGYRVSVETHGEVSIAAVTGVARIVMDIKTPGSGMCRGGYVANLPLMRPGDEIKFVLTSESDYAWAKERVIDWRGGADVRRVQDSRLHPDVEILFSAAVPAPGQPGSFKPIRLPWLASRILEDRLPVRLQTQLHKVIWGPEKTGV